MAHTNSYRSPENQDIVIPSDDQVYDLNFCLPVPGSLESERVRLVPFVASFHQYVWSSCSQSFRSFQPAVHFDQYFQGVRDHPELFTYLPYGPFTTTGEARIFLEDYIRSKTGALLFTILDRTKRDVLRPCQGGTFAGVIAYINTFPEQLSTEIGHVCILPAWQKTFLTTNAAGLLMKHALDLPRPDSPNEGGWGLRRLQWQANEQNEPSVRAAKRLGFNFEGIIRWQRILMDENKAGVKSRQGDPLKEYPGRHTAMLSMCWDDWMKDGRNMIEAMMARRWS